MSEVTETLRMAAESREWIWTLKSAGAAVEHEHPLKLLSYGQFSEEFALGGESVRRTIM